MKYATGTVAILAPSRSAGRDAILQYGVCDIFYPTDDQVTVIPSILITTTYDEIMALPFGIPWVKVDEPPANLVAIMKSRFGLPITMAEAIKALNEEYAIHPSKLMT